MDGWMKRNYQSWRSQLDGISPPPSFLSCRAYNRNSTFLLPLPSPSRSSPTLAHNLYYDRGAHIINLIKRSALKIVLLVRQLLTAAACLPACPPHPSLRSARCFSASFSAPLFIPSSHFRRFATELPCSLSLSFSPFLSILFFHRSFEIRLPWLSFRRMITRFVKVVSNGSLTLCCDEYFFSFWLYGS